MARIGKVKIGKAKKRRLQFLFLPNLVTSLNLFSGFMSVIFAFEGKYSIAFYLIILGALFDLIDGRLARMRETSSQFGLEFDSLSDMVTFGIAPSILVYNLYLSYIPRWGKMFAFSIVVAAALRLARYNVTFTTSDRKYFHGMSSPIAALLISSFCILLKDYDVTYLSYIFAVLSISISYLMISSIRFRSFKDVRLGKSGALIFWFMISILFAAFLAEPALMMFLGVLTYSLWCFADNLRMRSKKRDGRMLSAGKETIVAHIAKGIEGKSGESERPR